MSDVYPTSTPTPPPPVAAPKPTTAADPRVLAVKERLETAKKEADAKAKVRADRNAKGFSGEYVASLVAVLNYIADRAHIRGQEYNTLIGELADYADPVAVAKPEETKAATGATGTTGAAGFSPIPR